MLPPPKDDAESERTQRDGLENQQQELENRFRDREIAIKEGELRLKVTEQEEDVRRLQQAQENLFRAREITVKEDELKLKEKESERARWYNSPIFPLVLAIVGAILTGGFGVLTAWWNSNSQLDLEREKAKLNRDLETTRAEAARVLEMIKTNNDPDRAANNLKFLLDAGLISDQNTQKSIAIFLSQRQPGQGPSLPASVASANIDPDPQFKLIHETVPQLGKPRLPATLADDAYQAHYDNADVIWIKSMLAILVLPSDGSRQMTSQVDTDWTKDQRLFDDQWLRSQFPGIPEGKSPPHGGVAYYWLKDPDKWSWIGWRNWYCRYFNQIRYQQFENGVVFGIFHLSPTQSEGQILVVLNDGKWFPRHAGAGTAPNCLADALPRSGP